MQMIRLKRVMPRAKQAQLGGNFASKEDFDLLVQEDANILKPDGTPLLMFRKKIIPAGLCKTAYDSLLGAAAPTSNRGMAGGAVEDKTREYRVRKDGTRSKTNHAKNTVLSGIVGSFDRGPRFPYCRQTAYTMANADKFKAALPFVRNVDKTFAALCPERHRAQMDMVRKTHPDWRIPGNGKVIFLCDDPDLPFPWKDIPKDCEFHCWYNSRLKPILAGQPPGLKTLDYPFAANQQSPIFTAPPMSNRLVYMGRPKGREKLFRWLSGMNLPISIHGRPKEWEGYNFPVFDAPSQPLRSTWYSSQLGSLGIADAKHKRMQWRTGRITHSILSGCPVIIEHDNDTFSLPRFSSTEEISQFIKKASQPDTRGKMLMEQQKLITNGTARIEATLSEYGL